MADSALRVDLADQRLDLLEGGETIRTYRVSTAANGPGERHGSECTPRGRHEIAEKIGAGHAEGAVFEGREATGEHCTPELLEAAPERDWILTRILWLRGLERGHNLGGAVDTLERFIYIHGCPDSTPLGVPGSHGCIRMSNRDVVDLFDRVEVGTPVEIS